MTTTLIGFESEEEAYDQAPQLGTGTTEITRAQMAAVLAYFGALELEYDGNLTPAEIHQRVAADAPGNVQAGLGPAWSAVVNYSEPVGNAWASSGSTWVHPTFNGGIVYTFTSPPPAYQLAKIEAFRIQP